MRRPPLAPLLALALLTGFAPAARAQGFHAVTSRDGVDVWAAGDGGTLWRSLDGGATFSSQSLGAKPLRAIVARDFGVLVVGDSGHVFRSTDDGGAFALQTIAGAPVLRAVVATSAGRRFLAGDGGVLLRSDDGGATWQAQASGTTQRLNALAFTDDDHGWAAGANGTLLRTTDGGALWSPVALPGTNELFAIAQSGSNIWIGGADGTLLHSTSGGAPFAATNLRAQLHPDVRAIALNAPGDLWIGGGGGFLRHSTDGGATWTFPVHNLHGPLSALAFANGGGWAVTRAARIVARWTGGPGWSLPAGATLAKSWQRTLVIPTSMAIRGNTLAVNPWNRSVLWAVFGSASTGTLMYRSPDEGETWILAHTLSAAVAVQANAFLISPRDTSVMLLASVTSGGGRQVLRSTTAGASWSLRLLHAFGEYGVPLAMHPDKPETLFFGGDSDTLYRSLDEGVTWSHFGTTRFRSPCAIVVVPDSNSVVMVGDGVTSIGNGDLWQSTNGGLSFTRRALMAGSEIPGVSCSRLRNNAAFATTWSADSIRSSSDFGATWPVVPDLLRSGQHVFSSWATDIAGDDPNLVIVGQYAGGNSYLSVDGGQTFSATPLSGSNYALNARDRATLVALQSNGLYKMRFAYAYTPVSGPQSVTLTAPNGGESWPAGSVHAITWNAANVALARIEWRPSAKDAWQPVALVEGYAGSFAWTVPAVPTPDAQVRVSDAWDASPTDASDAAFAIPGVPVYAAAPATLDLGPVDLTLGAYGTFTLSDAGSADLNVTGVTSDNPRFSPARSVFGVGVSASDTLGVFFSPVAAGPDSATLTLTADDPASPHALKVRGLAGSYLAAGGSAPIAFALAPTAPNPFSASSRTLVRFDVPRRAHVTLEVFDLQGQRVATLADGERDAGRYALPFGDGPGTPGSSARLQPGVFFLRMRAPGFLATRRVLVLR